nr:ATP phosphoribosyltransferase regulatory subunit [uncultured Halomonas sp.]
MTIADRWLLPDGMDEVLPPQATRMEQLRRALLDLYYRWGYDLVLPPPVEFLDSLLTGIGTDLDLQTFKLTDQLTGRMMGASADVTPQVARMDAHSLSRKGPARLCYCNSVLRAQADQYQGGRSPVQVGVELFGHAGLEADLEILHLALSSLTTAGAEEVHLALGYIGIYRDLISAADLDPMSQRALFEAIKRKSPGDVARQVDKQIQNPQLATLLKALTTLHGGAEVLDEARGLFAGASDTIMTALDQLQALYQGVKSRYPDVTLYLDLADLRGYQYHTGMTFAAYAPRYGQALVKGGRYDDTGQVFGRARPATGFSMDLKLLASLAEHPPAEDGIWAPVCETEPARQRLVEQIGRLRDAGERIVQALPGQSTGPAEHRCNRRLVEAEDGWHVSSLSE